MTPITYAITTLIILTTATLIYGLTRHLTHKRKENRLNLDAIHEHNELTARHREQWHNPGKVITGGKPLPTRPKPNLNRINQAEEFWA